MKKSIPTEMELLSGLSLPDLEDVWRQFDEWKRETERKDQIESNVAAQRLEEIEKVQQEISPQRENEQSLFREFEYE